MEGGEAAADTAEGAGHIEVMVGRLQSTRRRTPHDTEFHRISDFDRDAGATVRCCRGHFKVHGTPRERIKVESSIII